jgi:hypothetical protein
MLALLNKRLHKQSAFRTRMHFLVPKLRLGTSGDCAIFSAMSTLAEIAAAVNQLPVKQQEELFIFLAGRLGRVGRTHSKTRRGLKAATLPALEGLPAELSVGTRDRVCALMAKRHAANR